MIGEIQKFYQNESLLFHYKQMPEWNGHYSHAQALVQTAINATPEKVHMLVVGHGFGRELPIQILNFQTLTINDIDPDALRISTEQYASSGANPDQIQAVPGDVTGIVTGIETLTADISINVSTAQMIHRVSTLINQERQVNLGVAPADLTVSSLVLPHTWREPLVLLHSQLGKFKAINPAVRSSGFLAASRLLPEKMFGEHLQFLKRHTKSDGLIALITQIKRDARYTPQEVLPIGGEDVLKDYAARSIGFFEGGNIREWDWYFDENLSYRVLGVIIKANAIDEEK